MRSAGYPGQAKRLVPLHTKITAALVQHKVKTEAKVAIKWFSSFFFFFCNVLALIPLEGTTSAGMESIYICHLYKTPVYRHLTLGTA